MNNKKQWQQAIAVILTTIFFLANSAHAAEGGKSLYLLGKRGPLAGLILKPDWYYTNDVYVYCGDADQEIPMQRAVFKTQLMV